MAAAQIDLIESETDALKAIAQQTGKTPDELVREAVDRLIQEFQNEGRAALLRQARGMWRDRTDITGIDDLRAELDRAQR